MRGRLTSTRRLRNFKDKKHRLNIRGGAITHTIPGWLCREPQQTRAIDTGCTASSYRGCGPGYWCDQRYRTMQLSEIMLNETCSNRVRESCAWCSQG